MVNQERIMDNFYMNFSLCKKLLRSLLVFMPPLVPFSLPYSPLWAVVLRKNHLSKLIDIQQRLRIYLYFPQEFIYQQRKKNEPRFANQSPPGDLLMINNQGEEEGKYCSSSGERKEMSVCGGGEKNGK